MADMSAEPGAGPPNPRLSVPRLCGNWIGFVRCYAAAILLLSLTLTGLAGWYAATSLGINTSNDYMLSSELPLLK